MRFHTKIGTISETEISASISVSNDLVPKPGDGKRIVIVAFSGTFGIALNPGQRIDEVLKNGLSITADVAPAQ